MPVPVQTAWAEWGAKPESAYLVLGIYLAALALLAVGLFTRLTTVVCWALCVTFHHRLGWMMNAGDDIGRMGLFYLIFARSGAVWSLDALWRRQRTGTEPPEGKLVRMPTRGDVDPRIQDIREQLIIEFAGR